MRLVNHHFDMKKINMAFLLGGLLLLGTWVWAIYDDYSKPYKEYQRKFYEVYTRQLRLTKQEKLTKQQRQEIARVEQQLQQVRQRIQKKGGAVDRLKREIRRLREVKIKQADVRVQTINSKLKPVEYNYQQALARAEENEDYSVPQSLRQRYKELKRKSEQASRRLSRLQEKLEQKEQRLAEMRQEISDLKSKRQKLTQEIDVLEQNIKRISDRPINQLLDAPIINFISPRVEVKQYQVPAMKLNYNFDMVPRRDYCKSCHMGIDNPVFQLNDDGQFANENTRQAFQEIFPNQQRRRRYREVFKAHPRMDLIGPSNAKYPFDKYGCTGCHHGDGRALDFNRAAHNPDNKKETKRWKKLYHWHPRHYWEEPMYEEAFYSSAFGQFYPAGTRVDIPNAPRLNEGRDLWRKYGCNGCHAVEGMNYQRKIGFSLEHVASKVSRDWIRRWVEMPTDFDPTTRMPQPFHRMNISSPADRERSTVVIDSIATYLMDQSRPVDLMTPPASRGNAKQGKKLVQELGCYGCHSMKEEGIMYNTRAPDLSNVGEKVNREWLYTWLKNPERIWPETHMPSMKLTDREANDITEYLLQQKAENWSADAFPTELAGDTPLQTVIDRRLESMARRFISRTRGPLATRQKLEQIKQSGGTSKQARQRALKLYIGEQAVDFYGCSSCHTIPGHEGPNRIGTELSTWANKSTHKLAFNYIDIPHTRQDFLMNKLKHPGIYDRGLTKSYLEKYRMPKPNITDTQARKITTFVLSLKNPDRIEPSAMFPPSAAQELAYQGNKLIEAYNCQGCHTISEESPMGDYLRNYYERQINQGESFTLGNNTSPSPRQLAQAHVPPTLTNVGKRLQEDWIFKFLKNPVGPNGRDRIRTWQHVRMPNFQFSDEQASTISQGLVYEGWEKMPPKAGPESRQTTTESIRVGKAIFNRVCANCHIAGGEKLYKTPQMTPNLGYIGNKFDYTGFLTWIEKPAEKFVPEGTRLYRHQGMIPYTKVPATESFLGFKPEGDYSTKQKQMKALRDYLFSLKTKEYWDNQ